MTIKIISQPTGIIEVKRLYLENLKIEYTCPECGHKGLWGEYFSYPTINEPTKLSLCCHECWHNWFEMIKLNVNVEVMKDEGR